MKKFRYILTLIIVLSITVNPIYASNISNIKFTEVEGLVKKLNPTVRINENVKSNLLDSISEIEKNRYDLKSLRHDISDMDQAIKQQEIGLNDLQNLKDLQKLEEIIDDYDIDLDIGDIVSTQIKGLNLLYQSNISLLKKSRNEMQDKADNYDKLYSKELELEKAILNLEMANKNIIYGAQSLYLGYNDLIRHKSGLTGNLDLLEKQIEIVKLQEELGFVKSLDVNEVEIQIQGIKSTIKDLENQMETIKKDFNLMLGRDFHKTLELEDSFKIDQKIISNIDYKKDLKLAKRNNYSIKLKNYDYEIKDNDLIWAEEYGNYNDRRLARRDFENTQTEFVQMHKEVESTFDKIYEKVETKSDKLETTRKQFEHEEEKYRISELKYEQGMISGIELKKDMIEYNTKKNDLKAVKQDLFKTLIEYKGFLDGFNLGQK